MANPEDLTKEQLREELLAHGIKVPSGKLKAHFIELYNTHVMPTLEHDGDMYSDDNVQVNTSSSKRSTRMLKRNKVKYPAIPEGIEVEHQRDLNDSSDEYVEVQAIVKPEETCTVSSSTAEIVEAQKKRVAAQKTSDLDDLSNSEIADRFKKLGKSTGPIGPSTRNVYLKKLSKLLEKGDAVVVNQDKYSDEDEEEPPTVAVTRSSSKRRTMQTLQDVQPAVTSRRSVSSTSARRSMVVKQEIDMPSTQPAISTTLERSCSVGYLDCAGMRKPNESTPIVLGMRAKSRIFAPRDLTPFASMKNLHPVKVESSSSYPKTSESFSLFSDVVQSDEMMFDSESTVYESEQATFDGCPQQNGSTVPSNVATDAFSKDEKMRPFYDGQNVVTKDTETSSVKTQRKDAVDTASSLDVEDAECSNPVLPSMSHYADSFDSESETSKKLEKYFSTPVPIGFGDRARIICSSATRRRPLRRTEYNSSFTSSLLTESRVEQQREISTKYESIESTEAPVKPNQSTDEAEKDSSDKPERRWIPVWAQIVLTLLVVLFAYLVIQAMEKIPKPLSLPEQPDE